MMLAKHDSFLTKAKMERGVFCRRFKPKYRKQIKLGTTEAKMETPTMNYPRHPPNHILWRLQLLKSTPMYSDSSNTDAQSGGWN